MILGILFCLVQKTANGFMTLRLTKVPVNVVFPNFVISNMACLSVVVDWLSNDWELNVVSNSIHIFCKCVWNIVRSLSRVSAFSRMKLMRRSGHLPHGHDVEVSFDFQSRWITLTSQWSDFKMVSPYFCSRSALSQLEHPFSDDFSIA